MHVLPRCGDVGVGKTGVTWGPPNIHCIVYWLYRNQKWHMKTLISAVQLFSFKDIWSLQTISQKLPVTTFMDKVYRFRDFALSSGCGDVGVGNTGVTWGPPNIQLSADRQDRPGTVSACLKSKSVREKVVVLTQTEIQCHDVWHSSSRSAFFVWRAPIVSWPRIRCSQVGMLKFLESSREIP